MLSQEAIEEVMKRVRRLEIRAKRLVNESFGGEYHSSFKGQGLDFDEFREYQHGDEIRFIDWNVTARTGKPFIRKFREERELSVVIAVDISGSTLYGSGKLSKRELAAEIAAVLAFSARDNGDKVGLQRLIGLGRPAAMATGKGAVGRKDLLADLRQGDIRHRQLDLFSTVHSIVNHRLVSRRFAIGPQRRPIPRATSGDQGQQQQLHQSSVHRHFLLPSNMRAHDFFLLLIPAPSAHYNRSLPHSQRFSA